MKAITYSLCLFILVSLSGCSDKPLNRYKSSQLVEIGYDNTPSKYLYKPQELSKITDDNYKVKVGFFLTDIESQNKRNKPIMLNLEDKGQAQYISSIENICKDIASLHKKTNKSRKNVNTSDCFAKLLNIKFQKPPKSLDVDNTNLSTKLIMSIEREEKWFNPANRLNRVLVKLNHNYDDMEFKSWDKFETQYGNAELGKLTSKETVDFSGKISPTHSGTLVGTTEKSASYKNESTEEVTLKKRYIKLSGIMDPNEITLIQEGIVGIDLAGNSSINLHLSFSKSKEIDIYRVLLLNDGTNNISLQKAKMKIPVIGTNNSEEDGKDLILKGSGEFILRDVIKGGNSINEGDDTIRFIKGNIDIRSKDIILSTYKDLKKRRGRYFIYKSTEHDIRLITNDKNKKSSYRIMYFPNFNEAFLMVKFLKTNQVSSTGNFIFYTHKIDLSSDGKEVDEMFEEINSSTINNLKIGYEITP